MSRFFEKATSFQSLTHPPDSEPRNIIAEKCRLCVGIPLPSVRISLVTILNSNSTYLTFFLWQPRRLIKLREHNVEASGFQKVGKLSYKAYNLSLSHRSFRQYLSSKILLNSRFCFFNDDPSNCSDFICLRQWTENRLPALRGKQSIAFGLCQPSSW